MHHNKVFKSQRGFSAVETVLAIVIVALLGTVGYMVYVHHHKSAITSVTNPPIGSDTSTWVNYSTAQGNFSASFPTKPAVIPLSPQADGSSPVIIQFESLSIGTNYLIIYTTYPSGAQLPTFATSVGETIDQGTHLVSSKRLAVNGNQAETFEATGNEDGKKVNITGEELHVGQVIYDLIAAREGSTNTQAPNAQYFINSFKVGQ